MKKVFIKTAALIITALMLTTSCKKGDTGANGTTGATGAAGGPVMTGNIEGLVLLYDDGGNKIISPTLLAGDTIILTNNSNGSTMQTNASSTGSYTFNNVTSGTYSFTVTKHGYGTSKGFGFEFVGGGTTYKNFALSQLPTTNVVAVQPITVTSGTTAPVVNGIQITGTVTPSAEAVYVITYISSSISVNGVLGYYLSYITNVIGPGNSTFSNSINANTFYNLGMASGSPAYFASYTYGPNSVYTDPITGLNVYTALSSTPVITSCIVP